MAEASKPKADSAILAGFPKQLKKHFLSTAQSKGGGFQQHDLDAPVLFEEKEGWATLQKAAQKIGLFDAFDEPSGARNTFGQKALKASVKSFCESIPYTGKEMRDERLGNLVKLNKEQLISICRVFDLIKKFDAQGKEGDDESRQCAEAMRHMVRHFINLGSGDIYSEHYEGSEHPPVAMRHMVRHFVGDIYPEHYEGSEHPPVNSCEFYLMLYAILGKVDASGELPSFKSIVANALHPDSVGRKGQPYPTAAGFVSNILYQLGQMLSFTQDAQLEAFCQQDFSELSREDLGLGSTAASASRSL